MTSLKEYLLKGEEFLRNKQIEKPRLEAQLLFSHVLGMPRIMLYARDDQPLQDDEVTRLRELLVRKSKGEPTAYLTGKKEFFSRSFSVNSDVLIPRPESEELLELIISREEKYDRVLDLCTGSGCLGITIAAEGHCSHVCLADISEAALSIAAANAAEHLASDRYEVLKSDLGESIDHRNYDLIISNPPYITSSEYSGLDRTVKDFEPRVALEVADPETFFSRLFKDSVLLLRSGGTFAMESSSTLLSMQHDLAAKYGLVNIKFHKDLAGKDRFLTGSKA